MIDENKIIEAAIQNADKYNPCRSTLDMEEVCRTSFNDGIEWFKNAIWHDASEKPARYDTYLVKTKQGCLDFCHFATEKWHSKDVGTVVEWLDLADIKRKEVKNEQKKADRINHKLVEVL